MHADRGTRFADAARVARPHVERLTFTTPRHPDRAGRMDFRIAGRLAERHGLRHEVVRWSDASSGELQLWQFRTGAAVAGRTWEAVRTEERKWAGTYHVTGHGGEIGRAFYWREEARPTERAAGRIDPAEILRRLHLPRRALLMERCRVCLEGLAGHDLATILDLLYLEQRVGCWATIQFYGHVGPTTHVMAFAHRDTVEDFLRIPPALRRRDGLATTTISRAWPELLELPLNRFLGFEGRMDRALAPARRFLNDHPRIAGALRPGPRT